MKWNKAAVVVLVSALLGGFTSTAFAEDDSESSKDYLQQRTYIGGFGTSTNIDNTGDFNGTWGFSYNSGTEVDLIPSMDRNFGFGGFIGHREGPYALEVSYWRTDHNGVWGPAPPAFPVTAYGSVSYQSLNLDFKRYLFTQLPTQPFFSLGLNLPWVVAHQASGLNTTGGLSFADMTVAGIGFNLGIGMEVYLGPNYSIVGGAVQRWAGFNQINGALKKSLTPQLNGSNVNLEGDGLNFFVGATFGFE